MEYLTLNSFSTKRSVTIDSLKTHFLPIQEGEGDPSPDNIRPITGWNSIKVRKCGKNLAKIVGYSAQANNSSTDLRRLTNIYGTTISTTEYVSGNDKLVITQTVQPDDYAITSYRHGYVVIILDGLLYGKKYNFSFKVSDIVSNPLNVTLDQMIESSPGSTHYDPIVTEDNHVIFKNQRFTRHGTIPNRCSIEIRVCGMSFTLSEFMITAVEDEDFTYEPYREEEVEVELPETMYGGYVDIAKGELVQTCKLRYYGGKAGWSDGGTYTGHRFNCYLDNAANNVRGGTDIIACNYLKPAPNGQSANVAVYGNNIVTPATSSKTVYVNVDFADTVDEWKEYLAEPRNTNPLFHSFRSSKNIKRL